MSPATVDRSCTPLAVLVPCYNEAGTIAACVEQLLELEGINAVLLIDDGSRDGSSAICAALAAWHAPRVKALLLPQNVGKNAAIRAGASAVCNAGVPDTTAAVVPSYTLLPASVSPLIVSTLAVIVAEAAL